MKIEISGHTDNVGRPDYNIDLLCRRADAVKRHLLAKGVKDDRIQTRGAGPNDPIADNTTAKGRAKNRRIEFKLVLE